MSEQLTEFDRVYNKLFRGRAVNTQHVNDCEAIWRAALTTSQPAQAGEVDERAAFEAELAKMPEWAPECEKHRPWVEWILWVFWQARASLPTQPAAQATPEPDTCRKRPRCGRADPCAWLEKQATQQAAGEPEHHRQAWAALTDACQRVATADGSSAADLTRAIDRFTDVLMGDTHPAPGVPEDVQRDAERYRWLLDHAESDPRHPDQLCLNVPMSFGDTWRQQADAAIDAALAAAQAKGG